MCIAVLFGGLVEFEYRISAAFDLIPVLFSSVHYFYDQRCLPRLVDHLDNECVTNDLFGYLFTSLFSLYGRRFQRRSFCRRPAFGLSRFVTDTIA
jgi:hypothetical protein